jgi:hypothetical protein
MQDSDNPQGLFIRGIADELIFYGNKSQRAGGEIGPTVARIRHGNNRLDGGYNLVNCPVGGVEVTFSLGVEIISFHRDSHGMPHSWYEVGL